jgi:hypothetical protein
MLTMGSLKRCRRQGPFNYEQWQGTGDSIPQDRRTAIDVPDAPGPSVGTQAVGHLGTKFRYKVAPKDAVEETP